MYRCIEIHVFSECQRQAGRILLPLSAYSRFTQITCYRRAYVTQRQCHGQQERATAMMRKTNSIENHLRAEPQTRASSSIPGKFGRSPSNSRNCIKVNSRWVARQVRYEYVTLNRGHGSVSEHRRLDPHDRVTFNSALLSARFKPDPSRVRLFFGRP
jgi:hypothetical protein